MWGFVFVYIFARMTRPQDMHAMWFATMFPRAPIAAPWQGNQMYECRCGEKASTKLGGIGSCADSQPHLIGTILT